MRAVFSCWGRPQKLRVDNGHPWGSSGDLPPDLALWLVGLGIEVIWNRPHHPQENSRVERAHGILQPWVEASTCRDLQQLQNRVDVATVIQREQYPTKAESRAAKHPALFANGRQYSTEMEHREWDFQKVCDFLATGVFSRRVCANGQIWLYGRYYSVGRAYAKRWVTLRFDAQTKEWVVSDEIGKELKRHIAKEMTAEKVMALQVTKRKKKADRKGA